VIQQRILGHLQLMLLSYQCPLTPESLPESDLLLRLFLPHQVNLEYATTQQIKVSVIFILTDFIMSRMVAEHEDPMDVKLALEYALKFAQD